MELVIIGAGAAGLTAAIAAARAANERGTPLFVRILEHQPRAAKKLLATGNGRCNLSNRDLTATHFHSASPHVLEGILSRLGTPQIIDFFDSVGLSCRETADGLIYPRGMQAAAVSDCLRAAAAASGAQILCDMPVTDIACQNGTFLLTAGGQQLRADRVMFACGSGAAGGSDSGLSLLKKLGHSVIPPYPALVPLVCDMTDYKAAAGMRAAAAVSLFVNDRKAGEEAGEVQFTDYGLSGIAVMQLSRIAAQAFAADRRARVRVELDLVREYSHRQLLALLKARRDGCGYLSIEQLLGGILNKKIGLCVCRAAGVGSPVRNTLHLSDAELARLTGVVKALTFTVTGTKGFAAAQVCGGGADLAQFDLSTMQSRILGGLFAAGEVLDVCGDCGGYNLSWAWISGITAGCGAALM